jgi:hypothetical protein
MRLITGACNPKGTKHRMKTISKFTLAAAVMALPLIAARADEPLRGAGGAVSLFLETKDANGHIVPLPANAPDWMLLWGAHGGDTPLYAPDGHQLTWGEYKNAQVRAEAKCQGDGTHVVVHLSGLIPQGTYTIWVLVFDGPFPGATSLFQNLVGVGALGLPDGSENHFEASASGEGEITAFVPPQVLSAIPFDLTGCLLNEVEFHLVGVYHSDGHTYGGVPGYVHHAEVQFGVQMKP